MIEEISYPPLSPEGNRAADATIAFLEQLPQSKGAQWYGKPLDILPWQSLHVRELFGRRDPATGLRRYRKCLIFVPKKQGKSTLAAGLVLKLTIADGELGAECYGAAFDKEQARIVFGIAKAMVEQHPDLKRRCHIHNGDSRITVLENRSTYEALAHDVHGAHGFNIHGLVIDEFHTWRDGELYRTLDHGNISREQPLTIIITTAGVFDPESPCWKLYDYACKVRDGIIDDPTFLPVIYETPKDESGAELYEWDDPTGWEYSNPGLGVTVPREALERKANEAKHMPSEVLAFRQLHLNQWPEQLKGWLRMDKWRECGNEEVDEVDLRGLPMFLGVDLGSTSDLTALAGIIFLPDGSVAVVMRFFVPESSILKRSKEDGVQYDRWRNEGYIIATPGDATDYGFIRKEIHALGELFDIQEVAVDPWNALQLSGDLISDGFRVVKVPQTAAHLSYPAKELEKLVVEVQLLHGNNPVLTWCASNATIRSDSNGNIKPDKARSKEKIDGIAALVNALARGLSGKVAKPKWLISGG